MTSVDRAAAQPAAGRSSASSFAGIGARLGGIDRGIVRMVAAAVAMGLGIGVFLVAIAWFTIGGSQVGPPRTVDLPIPNGTAALVGAGRLGAIPAELSLYEGDKLIIRNDDVVTHIVGGWTIPVGTQVTIDANSPTTSVFACTIHPSKNLGIIVKARPGLVDATVSVLLVGLPIALVLALGMIVVRRLDSDDFSGVS